MSLRRPLGTIEHNGIIYQIWDDGKGTPIGRTEDLPQPEADE